ncbi:MAG TPA: hydrogenase maturation nickel metallochaperone HypA [Acidimicrobiales bacterium]|nr:hydrogenase maturation nickel metallochaperone HypA [Acidimicrobiales bacterium]
MHELGLCSDVVAAVERRAGQRPVARVRIRVGRLHHVHPEAFEQSFALAAAGGVAAGAVAELVVVPVTARCPACGLTAESDEVLPACPTCGAVGLQPLGGDELILEAIEYRAQPQEV